MTPSPADPEYLKAMDQESDKYDKAMNKAWAEYVTIVTPIRKAHDEARKQIRIAYGVDKETSPADLEVN